MKAILFDVGGCVTARPVFVLTARQAPDGPSVCRPIAGVSASAPRAVLPTVDGMSTDARSANSAPISDPATAGAARALRFYKLVDSGDIAGLTAMFTEDGVYRRPGYEPMLGREGITDFYRNRRVIREGKHTLTSIIQQDSHLAAVGEFHGVLHNDTPVDLRFTDVFVSDADGAFSSRETFFFAPLV